MQIDNLLNCNISYNSGRVMTNPNSTFSVTCTFLIVICKLSWAQGCVAGVAGCSVCLNTTHCISCQDGYRVRWNQTCQICSDSNCQKCNYGRDQCLKANNGYTVVNYRPVQCQVANCKNCDGDVELCTYCKGSYGKTAPDTCTPCAVSDCNNCYGDINICGSCKYGFYLTAANYCQTNTASYCLKSFAFGLCAACEQRYGLVGGVCYTCIDIKCKKCDNDVNICTLCQDLYGVNLADNTCIRCADPSCVVCGSNAHFCTGCEYYPWVGLNSNGGCSSCMIPSCIICHLNVNQCQHCTQHLGVDLTRTQCISCVDTNCRYCSQDYSNCTQCIDFYGFNNLTCAPCVDPNCGNCLADYDDCVQCKVNYGFSNHTCIPCEDINCNHCYDNYQICTQCKIDYGVSVNSTCQLCVLSPNHCEQCRVHNILHCNSCPVGRILNNVTNECQQCSLHCQTCVLNPIGVLQCVQCVPNITGTYYILQNFKCKQIICGDLNRSALEECDNYFGRPYDGCDDFCLVQDNFTCFENLTYANQSICSYTGILEMSLISFGPQTNQVNQNILNSFLLRILIFPPLYVLSILPDQQLKKIFFINSDVSLETQNLIYNPQKGTLQFSGSIKNNIPKNSHIQILFFPPISPYLQFTFTPENKIVLQTKQILHYYSPEQISIRNIILYLCYMLSILGWISLLLGIFLKKLAGLQAMFVLQISFFTFFLFSSDFLVYYESLFPLKFTTGYNHQFIAQSQRGEHQNSEKSPYYQQFKMSQHILINNFNLSMSLQLLALIMIVITYYRLKKFLQNYRPEQQQPQSPSQFKSLQLLQKRIKQFQFSCQLLMTACMTNLMYFILCSMLFFKSPIEQLLNVPSLAIFSLQLIIMMATFIKFCCDPSPFDYFRFSFDKSQLAMRHYCIYILFLVILAITLPIGVEQLSYICVLPVGCMLVYTAVYRPYRYWFENIRSTWNLVVMGTLLFYRFLIVWKYPQQLANSEVPYLYFIICLSVLLPLTMLISIVSIIYCACKQGKQKKKTDQSAENRQLQIQLYRRRLLGELVRINPNKKIQQVKLETTFRQLINPDFSLARATNQLRNFYQNNYINQNNSHPSNSSNSDDHRHQETDKNAIHQINKGLEKPRDLGKYSKIDGYKKHKQMLRNQLIKINNNDNRGVNKSYNMIENNAFQNQYQESVNNRQQTIKIASVTPSRKAKQLEAHKQQKSDAGTVFNKEWYLNTHLNKKKEEYVAIESREQLQKHLAADIMKDQNRFIDLSAAISNTKQRMKETIQGHIIQEYDKIDMLIGNTGNNRIQDKDIRITMNSQRHDDQAHGSHSAAIVDSSQCKGSDIQMMAINVNKNEQQEQQQAI